MSAMFPNPMMPIRTVSVIVKRVTNWLIQLLFALFTFALLFLFRLLAASAAPILNASGDDCVLQIEDERHDAVRPDEKQHEIPLQYSIAR